MLVLFETLGSIWSTYIQHAQFPISPLWNCAGGLFGKGVQQAIAGLNDLGTDG
jgi:hypothetical protein